MRRHVISLVAGSTFSLVRRARGESPTKPAMRIPPADLRLYYIQRPPPQVPAIRNPQTYFPSLEILFPSLVDETTGSPTLAATELALEISGDRALVENTATRSKREVPVWIRPMHLVAPLDYLEGEYVLPRDGALPASRGPWQRALRKLNDPFNEAYTDAVFACMASRLVETARSPHWCRFYGTMNGRVPEYRYNITEDMQDIEGEEWFTSALAKGLFSIEVADIDNESVISQFVPGKTGSPRRRSIGSNAVSVTSASPSGSDVELLEEVAAAPAAAGGDSGADELVEAEPELELEVASAAPTVRRPHVRLSRHSGDSSASSSGSGDSDESDGLIYRAVMPDFPAQMTFIERCDGTMDDLMEAEIADDATADMRETKEQRWTAWLFQVVAALAVAQQTYDFVHNDLHTNNVMWCGTGETHLYYHVTGAAGGDRYYKVPTYGRIFKIIDFGRATFRPPAAAGGNHLWMPDAYAPGGDAAGQYNCGQHFEQGRPKIQPSKSFDLCRLAVAVLDTLWEDAPPNAMPKKVLTREPGRVQHETKSPLWNLLWLWLTDREGKNVLRAPDDSERYPEFDLYCAIARDVHNAVPAQQLTLPLFDTAFRCPRKDVPAEAPLWKLQAASSR